MLPPLARGKRSSSAVSAILDFRWTLHRLESVRAVLGNGVAEDPLENEEQVQDQMDSLPYMCRFQYEHAAELITSRMDPLLAAYSKVRGADSGVLILKRYVHHCSPRAT